MSITVKTIDHLLKYVYSDGLAEQMNTGVSELYDKIFAHQKSTGGKAYVQPIQLGMDGGVGFSTEADLPNSASPLFDSFKVETKNIFGNFTISLKALKTNSTKDKILNFLDWNMKSLAKTMKFHKARALEGSQTGVLAKVGTAVTTASNKITVDDTRLLEDGMIISVYTGTVKNFNARIRAINHTAKELTLDSSVTVAKGDVITNQDSLGLEYTGLADIFSSTGKIYGIDKKDCPKLVAYQQPTAGAISDLLILNAIEETEKRSSTKVDFLNCSYDVVHKYVSYKEKNSVQIASMELEGGYTSISFNGLIPMVKSRFAPAGNMDLLDTSVFDVLHLGTPGFVQETGTILVPVPGKAEYAATYADFSEVYCSVPGGQGRLTGITEAV